MNRDEAIERAAREVWNSFQEFQLPYNGCEWQTLIGLRDALALPATPAQQEGGKPSSPGASRAGRGA